ncbi:hypothetical protein HYPSUDRAFT_50315 [Hypholoma sublateritium FD-334 SS-4]|uniref:INO80 complex subunit F domain-containing protein n=1 Tax=Hypholoma sublateritium (strain FD-334 SS-4) TaxID=945553 RepID=A0A0D2QDZ7_HYPSF|nr:hypothetical protein HYPSUDRAFT_50315 [Hypholoma sublateritium FD-334 SS-4]
MASPAPAAPPRPKPAIGIAAGAEDAKYQAKYKELKRKVKDIEADNDKLHYKVLQAKLSVRRMQMERAVLYERLAAVPASPGPPPPPPDPEHAPARPPAANNPPSPRIPIHSPRHAVHDAPRHHLPPLAPTHPHPYDPRGGPQHSPPARPPRSSAHAYRGAPHHYDSAPPPQRRDEYGGDPYERHSVHPPLSPRAHPGERRVHAHQRLGPGTYIGRDDYPEPYLERDWERERDRDRDREARHRPRSSEYAREAPPPMHSPPHMGGGRGSREYDAHAPPPPPPPAGYYHEQPAYGAPRLARADTPGSGSASGSGGAAGEVPAPPYYERRARSGSFRVREDGGGEYSGGFGGDERAGGRKRSRADMEGESEHEGGAEGGYSHARRREGARRRGDEDARMGAS